MTHPGEITPGTKCENCGLRDATICWVGEGGGLDWSHGFWQPWCELCAKEAQLVHAEEAAASQWQLREDIRRLRGESRWRAHRPLGSWLAFLAILGWLTLTVVGFWDGLQHEWAQWAALVCLVPVWLFGAVSAWRMLRWKVFFWMGVAMLAGVAAGFLLRLVS